MLMKSFHSYAQTFDYGNFRFEIISEEEKTCEVIELTNNEKSEALIVPSEAVFSSGIYRVVRVGEYAIESCKARNIVISEGIQEIEQSAFRYSLCRSVAIPTTLKVIRESAFFMCDSLAELHIGNLEKWCEIIFENQHSSPFGEKNINDKKKLKKAYLNGNLITKLEIPSSIDTIKNYTFFGWDNLETLIIPATIKRISDDAFVGCSSLNILDIEDSDESLSIGVNSDNGSAYIPGGRKYPMFEYSPLTTINVGRNLSYTTDSEARSPFTGIKSLKNVNFSHYVTEIPNNLFAGCSYFPIYIPNSVTFIGNSAFSTGSYLDVNEVAEIYIPSSVKYCGSGWPFAKIRKVYIDNLANWCNMGFSRIGGPLNSNGYSDKVKQCQLYVNGEETADLIIPEGVKSINRAFYGWSSLKSIILSSDVKEIGDSAFYLCKSLDMVEFNEGLTKIGDYAFKGTILTKLNLPQTLTKIGLAAFIDCNLKNLIIPDNVIEIGDYAFAHMHDVESITLGGGLEKIGKNAFYFSSGSTNYFPPSKLECRTTLPPTCDGEFINQYYESTKLIVPDNGLKSYMESAAWQKFNSIETYPINLVQELGLTAHEVLVVGDTMRLSPVINPESASNKHLVWICDNNDVATVNELGLVTAISVGDANITCSTVDGSCLSATCKVTVSPIFAESIALDKTELTLTIGASENLTATVLPEDVTDKTVTWSTSDASIATVDNEGKVTAVSIGEATITATCGDKSATCKVTVNPILAESIALDKTELSLTIGASEKLTATVLPEDVTDKTVTWSTSDAAIAMVDAEGNVKAISVGEATITATCGDKTATCKVTVNPILAESITLDKTELTLTIGACKKLTATVLPEDVTDKTVTWSASDAAIATVDNEGNVTAILVGEATITATCDDKSATCKVTVNPILAESITLDKSELTLTIGASEKLTATVLPEDVTDKTVTWSTSDAAIAMVDAEGNVKAISVGEATITATCGDKTATCKVTVNPILAESITLDKPELTLTIGASEKLTATVFPEDVTDKTVTWSTSDAAIATVDNEGNVTAVSVGEATITATCGDKSATCKVTVNPILAESITLDKTELSLTIGETDKLTATVLPEDVTDKTVTWSTSDAVIATVDTEGNVTAVAVGEATITATCGDKTATCKVTVSPILAESITIDKTELSLTIGETEKLTATVLPEDVTDKTVTWSTSDASIATVDAEGNVKAIAVGEATITATCGDKSATCKVTVNPILAESIALDKTELTLTIGASEKLTATVLPEDVTDKTVTWSTSDAAIATVDTEGNVSAVSVGEAVITATCGEISTSCRVIVEKISGIVFVSADDINIVVNGNELTIKGATSEDKVTIVRQDGAVIYSGNNRESYTLVRGLYIILVNDATYKVVIN